MAARWSALALGFQLLLAAGLAVALAAASDLSAPAVTAMVIVELACVAFLSAVAPLALGRSMAPGTGRGGHIGHLLRALCTDAVALELLLARLAVEPWRAPPDSAVGPGPLVPRPVLLVHGFSCSRAVWRPLLPRLRAAGIGPVRAVSLEPLFAGIETYAARILEELELFGSRHGCGAITIVAHSMGGLVARAALRGARPGLIGRIITIGAPHHGTALACRFPWLNARQMCFGSAWMAELNASQKGGLGIPVTTIYSIDDNYVVPAGSARLEGARTLELHGIGHLGLLNSKRVLEQVVSELLE